MNGCKKKLPEQCNAVIFCFFFVCVFVPPLKKRLPSLLCIMCCFFLSKEVDFFLYMTYVLIMYFFVFLSHVFSSIFLTLCVCQACVRCRLRSRNNNKNNKNMNKRTPDIGQCTRENFFLKNLKMTKKFPLSAVGLPKSAFSGSNNLEKFISENQIYSSQQIFIPSTWSCHTRPPPLPFVPTIVPTNVPTNVGTCAHNCGHKIFPLCPQLCPHLSVCLTLSL